jgi:hypothetical protein
MLESQNLEGIILSNLICHLKKNSTLSNMSAGGDKADDFNCFIGRGESITDIVAKITGVDIHTIDTIEKGYQTENASIIDDEYLKALLKGCGNENLVNAVKICTGISVEKAEKKALVFKATDEEEDEFIAKTPFYDYIIDVRPKGCRLTVSFGRHSERLGAKTITWAEAILLSNNHCNDFLNKAVAERNGGYL